jgi:hypothetical protein
MHKRLLTVSILFISIFVLGACTSDQEPISPNDTFLAPATASIDLEKSKTFVQRSNSNEGEIIIKGQAGATFQTAKIKFINRLGGQATDWQNLTVDMANKQFSGKFKLVGGGYYPQIQLITDGKVVTDGLLPTTINVGEVFAVIGHSISEGQEPYVILDYDRTWCQIKLWPPLTEKKIYFNPSFWGRVAEYTKKRFNVPVMIFNTGQGGSTSVQWGKSAYGEQFEEHDFYPWRQRQPYARFEQRLVNEIKQTGLRAIFVVHGENDYWTAENDIVYFTGRYIQKTRELLNHPQLPFLISKSNAGQNIPEQIKVRRAQKRMLQEIPNTFEGANLEFIKDGGMRWDGVHYNFAALEIAAIQWKEVLTPLFFQVSKPFIPAN